jgi:hypothetical protein
MRLRSPLFSVALSLLLAACSHTSSDAAPPAAAAPPAPKTVAATPAAPATPSAATVTAAEMPFEQYQAPGDDALAWVGLYYAVAGTPVDYAAIAARLDPIFRATTDAFAQRDAVAGVKAKLDAAIAAAKANPHVKLSPVVTRMPAYDLTQNHYDLGAFIGPDLRIHIGAGVADVAFAANPSLASYAPANEAEARALEHSIGSNPLGRQVQFTVYGKVVVGALHGGEPQLTIIPTRVVVENYLLGRPPEPLFTATAP